MPGFGCTSTVRTIFPPAAALISAGVAAMSACLEAGAPRNCRFGVACARTTDDSSRTKAVLFTNPSYTTIDAEHAEPAEADFSASSAGSALDVLLVKGFEQRADPAADRRSGERAGLAAERAADAGAGRRRPANHEGRLLPVPLRS